MGQETEPAVKLRVAVLIVVTGSLASAQTVPSPAPAPVSPAPAGAGPRVAVFRVHVGPRIDPSLSALCERQLTRSAQGLGYQLTDPAVTAHAAAGLFGALTPERATGLVQQTGSAFGLFAHVESSAGRYRVSIQLAAANAPLRSSEAWGVSTDLYASIDQAVRSLLPPAASLAPAMPAPPLAPARREEEEPFPEGRFRLAFGGSVAFGVSPGPFRNVLAGARADRRFTEQASMGLALYYANLKGRDGRAHNLLPLALFEYRIDLGSDWAVPLRFGSGYLPKNGPVVKLAAGVSLPLGENLELSTELFAPTVWITNERAVLSLDLGAEIGVSF